MVILFEVRAQVSMFFRLMNLVLQQYAAFVYQNCSDVQVKHWMSNLRSIR